MINHDADTNGHGKGPLARLHKLLAHHEESAAAIRTTLGLLNGHATDTAKAAAPSVLAAAVALDAMRRGKGKGKWKGKRGGATAGARKRSRKRSATLLAGLSTTTPRPIKGAGVVGRLVTTGYIKRKGDGYVRTDKAFAESTKRQR